MTDPNSRDKPDPREVRDEILRHPILDEDDHSAQMDLMRANLFEGDLGAQFRHFWMSDRGQGEWVVRDALARYRAFRQYWNTVGEFALNYVQTAAKHTEPHMRPMPNRRDYTYGAYTSAVTAWYDASWEFWASTVREFAMGG